uniref:Peptidase A1 domain-containing protein n=1 Tax=Kalanchoe fedtschenkoi TaxID=63787 RepID=A0A7N0VHW6_KALFE
MLPVFIASECVNGESSSIAIDLIRGGSSASPFYKVQQSFHQQRFDKFFQPRGLDLAFPVQASNGQYIARISIGSPPFEFHGIVDSGSDLLWTQCLPCELCYNQTGPKYDPAASSTAKALPCQSDQCKLLSSAFCAPDESSSVCNYTYGYGAGLSKGVLLSDTLTFGDDPVPDVVFGCARNTTGNWAPESMGLIGLGGGPVSILSQLSDKIGGKKYSQCLVPFKTDPSVTSKLILGGEVSGDDVVLVPIVPQPDPTFYSVTLSGISVGDKLLPFFSNGSQVNKGNVIFDSGTPPMLLPKEFRQRLIVELRNAIPITPDPSSSDEKLCYAGKNNVDAPVVTLHLDGADMPLRAVNTFVEVSDGVYCFAVDGVDGEGGIIGNFAQSNFLIGLDWDKKTVSFKPADCTKEEA